MKFFICLNLLFGSSLVSAQDSSNEPPVIEEVPPQNIVVPTKTLDEAPEQKSEVFDQKFSAQFNYSYLDLIVPGKSGVTISYHRPESHQLIEFEYLKGDLSLPSYLIVDIGGVVEQRFSLHIRHFGERKSFNWFWGVHYNRMEFNLGSEYLKSVPAAERYAEWDILDVQTLGLSLGLGHRWYWNERFYLTLDWISWAQPLSVLKEESSYLKRTKDPDNRSVVDKALSTVIYFPRFSLLKASVGLSF